MPKVYSSTFLEKIADPKQRPKGSAGWTSEESQQKGAKRAEIPEQRTFCSWLERHNILYINPRSDKKTTIRKGSPDFSVFQKGRTLFIEFKATGCVQSEDQITFMNHANESGFQYFLVYSADEAIRLCRSIFSPEDAKPPPNPL